MVTRDIQQHCMVKIYIAETSNHVVVEAVASQTYTLSQIWLRNRLEMVTCSALDRHSYVNLQVPGYKVISIRLFKPLICYVAVISGNITTIK